MKMWFRNFPQYSDYTGIQYWNGEYEGGCLALNEIMERLIHIRCITHIFWMLQFCLFCSFWYYFFCAVFRGHGFFVLFLLLNVIKYSISYFNITFSRYPSGEHVLRVSFMWIQYACTSACNRNLFTFWGKWQNYYIVRSLRSRFCVSEQCTRPTREERCVLCNWTAFTYGDRRLSMFAVSLETS